MGIILGLMIALAALFNLGCSQGGVPYNPNAPATSPTSPGTTVGGILSPTPSNAPPNSYATTTGGYITLETVTQNPIDSSESFIGATMAGTVGIILFEHSPSQGIYMWDVFELSVSGSISEVCSVPIPSGSGGTYNGVTYNGSQILVLNSNYQAGLNVYGLDLSNCSTSFVANIYNNPDYYVTYAIPFAYYSGNYYTDAEQLSLINSSTNLVTPFAYSQTPISGQTPEPDTNSFTIDNQGRTWYFDGNNNSLWSGKADGSWIGWAGLPVSTYNDLIDAQSILAFSATDVRLVALNTSASPETLDIYSFDVSNF